VWRSRPPYQIGGREEKGGAGQISYSSVKKAASKLRGTGGLGREKKDGVQGKEGKRLRGEAINVAGEGEGGK